MIKVKVRPTNSQLVIHTFITLLANTVDIIDDIVPFTSGLHLNADDQLNHREKGLY